MNQKKITSEEHYVLIQYYQNKIKDLENDLFNFNMKNTAQKNFIKTLEAKMEILVNNNILT